MQALVLNQNSFQLEVVDNPTLTENQALVKIKYAALNHRDQWIREGQYAKIQLPAILGSDGCGEVVEVFNEADKHWIGKEVILNPNINWGTNQSFQSKDYQILGMPAQGTLAEYIVVNTNRLYEKPTHLSAEQAAALPLAGMTAYNALFNKGNVEKGMNVLISGVGGGVAQFAFLFAHAVGCNVYVTSSKNEVLKTCKNLGAKDVANYTEKDAVKNLSKSIGGFDVIIDSACGDGMNELVATLKPTGKFVFYGATRGLPKELNMRPIFWNHLQILGSTMGSDDDFIKMIALCNEYLIKPILDKTFDFANAVAAFDRMKDGAQFGKIIVKVA
ncbi:MAG TPA: zinc-binding dehydrogenase [Chitinophagales bacterium]|nr:zinc-binding dehydrogenase [Chitinophagales bacterium]